MGTKKIMQRSSSKPQKLDIHNAEEQYQRALKLFETTRSISDENKKVCLEYVTDCGIGWGHAKPVGLHRAIKYFQVFRILSECLEAIDPKLTWAYLEIRHTKQILTMVEHKEGWGEWYHRDAKLSMRKFMLWLRKTHGYPADYPDSAKLNSTIPMVKFPCEVDYNIPRPNKVKPISEILTADEVDALINTWDMEIRYHSRREDLTALRKSLRNKALLSVLSDCGGRIGGIGNLRISDIVFDNLGAKIAITDKTMRGEPVRLVFSVAALKDWLDMHPDSSPESPLWVDIVTGKPMTYHKLIEVLRDTRILYNTYAKERGLAPLTKRIHFHGFRYFAQTRDVLAGMPISVQCAQRGWSPTSEQPQAYARVSTDQTDEWMRKHYGLKEITDEDREAIGKIVSKRSVKKDAPAGYQ